MGTKLMAVSAITLLLLVGCNTNDHNNAAPDRTNDTPMDNVREDTQQMMPDVTPDRNNNNQNGVDVQNGQDTLPPEMDQNRNGDKDMMKDANTKDEEIIEDDLDARDKDNKDR